MRVRKRWLMRKVALPPVEVRSPHATLHIEFRGCPVRVDPGRGSHMLRQTEKGVQSEFGRSQGKAVRATSWYCLWGGGGVWRAAWIAVYMADLRGRDPGKEAFLGKIRHNILHAVQEDGLRLSGGCQTSDTCQRGQSLSPPETPGRHG